MGIIENSNSKKKNDNKTKKTLVRNINPILEKNQMGELFKVVFAYNYKNNNFFGFE